MGRVPRLLHLDSSIGPATGPGRSRSREVTATFARVWAEAGPDHEVVRRDLVASPLPHLLDPALHWAPALRPEGSSPDPAAEAVQAEVLAELISVDVVLIGAPMYNYSLPSTLKTWVDHVHVPGTTTPFPGHEAQPLKGRAAVVVTSRGGTYDAGTPTESWDHAVPPLQIVLGDALGMDVSVITTSATLAESVPALADGAERAAAELAHAHEQAAATARQLAALLR